MNATQRLEEAQNELNELIANNKERYAQHRAGDSQRDFCEAEIRVQEWKDGVKAEKESEHV
jgi:hypothetical protein